MRVQALDADTSSGNPARWERTRSQWIDERITQFGVLPMSLVDVCRGNFQLCPLHSAIGFESTHEAIQIRVAEPEESWHGCSVEKKWRIANHHWATVVVADDNDEFAARFSAEELRDDGEVVLVRARIGQ